MPEFELFNALFVISFLLVAGGLYIWQLLTGANRQRQLFLNQLTPFYIKNQ